jgi:hypothetical protein
MTFGSPSHFYHCIESVFEPGSYHIKHVCAKLKVSLTNIVIVITL